MPIFLGVVREGEQLSQLAVPVVSVCRGSGGCCAVWSNTNVQTCEDISPTDRATVGHRPPARALTSHTFQIASRYYEVFSILVVWSANDTRWWPQKTLMKTGTHAPERYRVGVVGGGGSDFHKFPCGSCNHNVLYEAIKSSFPYV